jgi:hypothetical protein
MSTHQSMSALAADIFTPADHAVLGAQLGQAGLNETEVSNLMRLIEDTAYTQAKAAARATALNLVPVFMKLLADTHRETALEIHRRLANRTGGLGGVTLHARCADIAHQVAMSTPRHVPPSAHPIVGSIR